MPQKPRHTCPACHLPIEEGQRSIYHQGHFFHEACAPRPDVAGEKDDVNHEPIAI